MTPAPDGPPVPAGGRLPVLDELKGVAILGVFLYHAGGVMAWRNVLQGQVGVDMFVVLSGIGLALRPPGGGALRFLQRRFWRIYPTYWIVLTGFLLADAHFLGWHFSAEDIVLHYLGLHALFGSAYEMSINDSFWFVTLIVCLYLGYAPLMRPLSRPRWILGIGVCVMLAAIVACALSGPAAGFAHLALRLPGFFIGLLLGHRIRTGRLGVPVPAALAGAFVLLVLVPYALGAVPDSAAFALAVMAAYAFLAAPALPATARSCLGYLGVRSLGIFLIHQPLIREYNVLVHGRMFPDAPETPAALASGIAVGAAAAIALAACLHSLLSRVPMPGGARRAVADAA
jgi:peptidoglycan/LPS O-acetylase OafA/YrhL